MTRYEHPRWAPQPATLAAAPLWYNAPDWNGSGVVFAMRAPCGRPAAHLVWQDPDRIGLVTAEPAPDELAATVVKIARDTLQECVYIGYSAAEARDAVLAASWHERPRRVELAFLFPPRAGALPHAL